MLTACEPWGFQYPALTGPSGYPVSSPQLTAPELSALAFIAS